MKSNGRSRIMKKLKMWVKHMRILHTADWHLGKTLEGRSRHAEQEQFIDELCEIVRDEKIHVILIAGDIYDTVNPPAASEQLFYEALSRLADDGKRQIVVISGNHDSPERLVAASPLANKFGITLIGAPVMQAANLSVSETGESLRVAALPYPSEARMKEIFTLSQEEHVLQQAYEERVRYLFNQLSRSFSMNSVNVVMSHLFVAGGRETDSERPIQVGGAYTVSPDVFPSSAQYVALGHLHRPQAMLHSESSIRYSGSPLAYSFSEAGQAKSVTIIDVEPGEKAKMKEVFLKSGKPLVTWQASSMVEMFAWLEEGRDRHCWVDVEIEVDDVISMEDIQRIRKAHDGIVHIRPLFRTSDATNGNIIHAANLPIDQLFTKFYERQTGGATPDEELIKIFFELVDDHDTPS